MILPDFFYFHFYPYLVSFSSGYDDLMDKLNTNMRGNY